MNKKDLDILIGLSPDDSVSIQEELDYIKIGLLYGDNITLVSPKSLLFLGVSNVLGFNERDTYKYFFDLVTEIEKNPNKKYQYQMVYNEYLQLKKKKHKNTQEIINVRNMELMLNNLTNDYRKAILEMFGEGNVLQFQSALNSNRLIVDTLDIENNFEFFNDKLIEDFFNKVSKGVLTGDTYPIYNKSTIDLLQVAINEGKIKIPSYGNDNIKNSTMASDLIMRLPVFEEATVDEIIDIRKELDKYVNNFRGAIVDYSEKIKCEPWSKDFENDAQKLFLKEVNPTVMALDEEIRSNNILFKMLENNLKNPISTGVPILGAVVSSLSNFVDLSTVSMLTGGLSIAGTTLMAYKEWKDKLSKIQQNQLYFYYKTGKKLKKRR